MTTIEVKGVIVANDYKEIYEYYGYECTSPNDVINQLPVDGSPIEVIINSGGGHVDAGVEIYTRLKDYKGEVTTKTYSLAGSAASIIAMGGDTVIIAPPAQFMIHNVSGVSGGDYREHAKMSQVLKNYNSAIANAYINKTGKTEDEILQLMNDETWLNSKQAVEHGFADEIMFEEVQLVASTNVLLPDEVIAKTRLMMKSPSSASVEGVTKADFETFKDEILNLIKPKEEPAPVEPKKPTNKHKGFFF